MFVFAKSVTIIDMVFRSTPPSRPNNVRGGKCPSVSRYVRTHLEWLSITRDLDLDLGSGHTAYRRASVIDLYIPNFIEIGKNFFRTDKPQGPLQVQGHVTLKTRTNLINPAR